MRALILLLPLILSCSSEGPVTQAQMLLEHTHYYKDHKHGICYAYVWLAGMLSITPVDCTLVQADLVNPTQ